MTKEFFIKGMVCGRCITLLRAELEKTGFTVSEITLGRAAIKGAEEEPELLRLQALLAGLAFELLVDKQTLLIRQIKEAVHTAIDSMVAGGETKLKLSGLLTARLNKSYTCLSVAFSQAEGITLEQYVTKKRMEKVKELLAASDSSLSEIAYITGFSSVQHLSKRFKDLTGLPPASFRQARKGLSVNGNLSGK